MKSDERGGSVGIYTGGPGRSWPIHPDEPTAPWTQTAFGNTNGTAVSWTGSERQRAEFGPDAEVTRWPGDHESRRRNRICSTTNMPSIEKARRMLGYAPRFSWRSQLAD